MTTRIFDSFSIFVQVLGAVGRSFLANRRGNNRWVPLPPVAPSINTSLPMEELVARVDRIVDFALWNTAHRCLYYSYARCRLLRQWGYSVKLNLGLHNLSQAGRDAEGHCWISLNDQALFEENDPYALYPDIMGERDDTVYWARLKGDGKKTYVRLHKK
jgi:hypothetical protein